MKFPVDELPVYYTNIHGKSFEKDRRLSLHDFHRMMKKLHWNLELNFQDLFEALLEKDTQRLRQHVNRYIETESKKFNDAGIFIRTPFTCQELSSVEYIICYRIYTELSVLEIEKEK